MGRTCGPSHIPPSAKQLTCEAPALLLPQDHAELPGLAPGAGPHQHPEPAVQGRTWELPQGEHALLRGPGLPGPGPALSRMRLSVSWGPRTEATGHSMDWAGPAPALWDSQQPAVSKAERCCQNQAWLREGRSRASCHVEGTLASPAVERPGRAAGSREPGKRPEAGAGSPGGPTQKGAYQLPKGRQSAARRGSRALGGALPGRSTPWARTHFHAIPFHPWGHVVSCSLMWSYHHFGCGKPGPRELGLVAGENTVPRAYSRVDTSPVSSKQITRAEGGQGPSRPPHLSQRSGPAPGLGGSPPQLPSSHAHGQHSEASLGHSTSHSGLWAPRDPGRGGSAGLTNPGPHAGPGLQMPARGAQ